MIINALKNTLFENIDNSNGCFIKHFHNTYTIGITYDGFFKSINQNKSTEVYKNATRIINPGEIHHGNSISWRYANFYPSVELLTKMYEEMFFEKRIPIFTKHIVKDLELFILLRELFMSIFKHSSSMQVESNLIAVLSYLIQHYTSDVKEVVLPTLNKNMMNNTLEYIEDCIESSLNLEQLANNSALSKYHFLRVFKKNVGLTPHHYIITRKVNKARDLIINGCSLSQAAFGVGFSDQSHFIRSFRKIYGYSPKTLMEKRSFLHYL